MSKVNKKGRNTGGRKSKIKKAKSKPTQYRCSNSARAYVPVALSLGCRKGSAESFAVAMYMQEQGAGRREVMTSIKAGQHLNVLGDKLPPKGFTTYQRGPDPDRTNPKTYRVVPAYIRLGKPWRPRNKGSIKAANAWRESNAKLATLFAPETQTETQSTA